MSRERRSQLNSTTLVEYEPVIGLEVHVQLSTRSKMFCACAADYQFAEANTRVCPVCLALPGALPVVNRQAIEAAMMIGLALNCEVVSQTKFDRKNYPYPDLMKGYQISQYDVPICQRGWMELPGVGATGPVRIRINRVHMEEDVARLIHIAGPDGGPGHTLMDVNRAGTPLMEIVSEPDIRSSAQAELYITMLQSIIRYLGVGTANMEEGSFRCDANVSVRPRGMKELATKVEVKNMNRIKAVTRAIDHEVARQSKVYRDGGRIVQETRGWDDLRGETVPQRSKEEAHDYRYFPEPDIPPVRISREWSAEVASRLPELPRARKERFIATWGLSEYDSALLTSTRATADYFEAVVAHGPTSNPRAFAKETANWLNGEMSRLLNEARSDVSSIKIGPEQLAVLVNKFSSRELNNASAKEVFGEMFRTGQDADHIISARGLGKVSDAGALVPVVDAVIASNPGAVADYAAGKDTALRFLIGQVMKSSRGQADPNIATKLLTERLTTIKNP